jgi:putative phosphoribosyl transferase
MARFGIQDGPWFADRRDAGRRLGERLAHLALLRPIVVGLPRGGVIVAAQVAAGLGAPLDLLVVRKLGAPQQPELALGAIAEGGSRVLNADVVEATWIGEGELARLTAREEAALADEVTRYRRGRPPLAVADRVVIIVDDGLATGATARAAIQALQGRGAQRIVLAVPVAPADTVRAFEAIADEVVVLDVPRPFLAVGSAYGDFSAATDEEVLAALDESARA